MQILSVQEIEWSIINYSVNHETGSQKIILKGVVGVKSNSLQAIWNGYNFINIAGVNRFEYADVNFNHDNREYYNFLSMANQFHCIYC